MQHSIRDSVWTGSTLSLCFQNVPLWFVLLCGSSHFSRGQQYLYFSYGCLPELFGCSSFFSCDKIKELDSGPLAVDEDKGKILELCPRKQTHE